MNYQANAATQLSAWVTAILIVISLAFIVNIFVYIPAAALAGIIIEVRDPPNSDHEPVLN